MGAGAFLGWPRLVLLGAGSSRSASGAHLQHGLLSPAPAHRPCHTARSGTLVADSTSMWAAPLPHLL